MAPELSVKIHQQNFSWEI